MLRDLTERVTIEQASAVADQARSKSWSTLDTVWAAVRPREQSGESVRAGAIGASLGFQVEIQYRADVTPKMRVQWTPYRASAARVLQIQSVTPKRGRHERLLLECSEAA